MRIITSLVLCSNLALSKSCHHSQNSYGSQSFLLAENASLEHVERNVEFLLQSISNAIMHSGLCKETVDFFDMFHSATDNRLISLIRTLFCLNQTKKMIKMNWNAVTPKIL